MGLFDSFFRKEPEKEIEPRPASKRLVELRKSFPFPLISVPGDEVESELRRLRANPGSIPGSPVAIGDFESAQRLVELWNEPYDFDRQQQMADALNVENWFKERRNEEPEVYDEDGQDEIHEDGTAPMMMLTIGHDFKGLPREEIFVATIPTADSTTIPLHLRFGDWNDCPSPAEHAAVARYWHDKYGAKIATVASDIVEFTVARSLSSEAETLELAWQQFAYCSDIVHQGVGSVATLARALRRSTRWYFWWD